MSVNHRRTLPQLVGGTVSQRDRTRAQLAHDPAFRCLTCDELAWIDPYTGTAVPAPFGFEDTALAWLLEHRPWTGGRVPKTLPEMQGLRWFLWLKVALVNPDYVWVRQFLPDGRWLNPFDGRFIAHIDRPDGQITVETARRMAMVLRDTPQAQGLQPLERAVLLERFEAERQRIEPTSTPPNFEQSPPELASTAPSRPVAVTAPAVRVVKGYRVLGELGSGGMSTVYRAIQLSMERQVALKVLDQRGPPDPSYIERFVREAHAVGRINHPNVVTCFDVGFDQDRLYMAMELMTGGDAAGLAEHAGGRLPEGRALTVVRDAARGLSAVHAAGLIHRDIKPANIFIAADGSAKLGDLGLCRDTIDQHKTELTTDAVGTPAFMSPEQAMGHKDLDIRSDLYALGACLFALITGHPPFVGDTIYQVINQVVKAPVPEIREQVPGVSAATALLIKRAMAKDRDRRFQTPVELEEALNRALAGERPPSSQQLEVVPINLEELWARAGIAVSSHSGSGATHAMAIGPDGPALCAVASGTNAAARLAHRLDAALGTMADPTALARQLHADGLSAAVISLDPNRRIITTSATAGARIAIVDASGDTPIRLLPDDAHGVPFHRGQLIVLVAGRSGSPLPLWSGILAQADRPAEAVITSITPLLRGAPIIVLGS